MLEDTFLKSKQFIRGDDSIVDEESDEEEGLPPGELVLESGEYRCGFCGETEFYGAGEELLECGCTGDKGWLLMESEADTE